MKPRRRNVGTTRPGFTNPHGQTVVRATGLAGTDHRARVYVLRCANEHEGREYGANGTDIWQRRCPICQGGAPGLAIDQPHKGGPF